MKKKTHREVGLTGQESSARVRWALRIAFTFFMRFLTEGFVKYARFLNSLRMPDRSYFFLKRLMARSMGSLSATTIPTKLLHLLRVRQKSSVCYSRSGCMITLSSNLRSPAFSNETTMACAPSEVRTFDTIFPMSSRPEWKIA